MCRSQYYINNIFHLIKYLILPEILCFGVIFQGLEVIFKFQLLLQNLTSLSRLEQVCTCDLSDSVFLNNVHLFSN